MEPSHTRSSIFTAYYTCRNAEMYLKSTTTSGFNIHYNKFINVILEIMLGRWLYYSWLKLPKPIHACLMYCYKPHLLLWYREFQKCMLVNPLCLIVKLPIFSWFDRKITHLYEKKTIISWFKWTCFIFEDGWPSESIKWNHILNIGTTKFSENSFPLLIHLLLL